MSVKSVHDSDTVLSAISRLLGQVAPSSPSPDSLRDRQGYTLIELLLVFSLMAGLLGVAWGPVGKQIARAKLTGTNQQVRVHLAYSRLEAMKRGFPAVVQVDYGSQSFWSFIDEDNDLVLDDTERVLYSLDIGGGGGSAGLLLMGADGVVGTDADPAESVEGLTPTGVSALRGAVFEPDGSIRDPGSFRVSTGSDPPRNAFEIRVSPQATADIEIRKYLYSADAPGGTAGFFSGGAGAWVWY